MNVGSHRHVGHGEASMGVESAPDTTASAAGDGRVVVCLSGAFAGSWCFERLAPAFAASGITVHTPDLAGHGVQRDAPGDLSGRGLADYRAELTAYLQALPDIPVLIGHSMGAVLAQQLAAQGLARALVLISPAPRAGHLPATDGERQAARGLMSLGAFWTTVVYPSFEVAVADSLNCVPEAERRTIFDRFGPESGRALFELFYWMFDEARASAVDLEAVRCPVLIVSGSEDRVVSPATARATAAGLANAVFREVPGRGHMMLMEPSAEDLAADILDWLRALPRQAER